MTKREPRDGRGAQESDRENDDNAENLSDTGAKGKGGRKLDPDDYKSIPPLAVYIDRIGAEQLNFRRFMVKEHRGNYYTERAIIKLEPDGTVEAPEEYAPTDVEADAIRIALRDVVAKWPRHIGAGGQTLDKLTGAQKSDLFEFWNVARTEIIMVQERVEFEDGSKAYLPWTFWSDFKWRRMEPEGPLPFWKPHKLDYRDGRVWERNKIMVHEGAKAAAHINALIHDHDLAEERKKHPWAEELSHYEHWGMIGGALAPHRADYSELRKVSPHAVVYVCDNDKHGNDVLQEFSRHYGGKLKGIMFDPRWPESWDMADPMPKKLFEKERYNGPSLTLLMKPATYATELIPNPRGGRPTHVLRRVFREEWVHSVRPEVFIHCDWPSRIWIPSEFNNTVKPYSAVEDTARLVRNHAASKGAEIKYDPTHKPGIYEDDEIGGRFINTHVPSIIRAEPGDVALFERLLEQMIPDEYERHETMLWCATLIARPDIKMAYGLLLISEVQGIGKTTLGERILAPLVGMENASFPSEHEICESGFNYWCSHKRLAVINEIYSGQSAKAYNRLKSIITDRQITVSKKFQANYEIQNWVHVVAFSNSSKCLKLSADDRRWLVPRMTETKPHPDFFKEIYPWLERDGGLGKVKAWAADYIRQHGWVQPGDEAPSTEAKKELIREQYSEQERLLVHLLAQLREGEKKAAKAVGREPEPIFTSDACLRKAIKNELYDGREHDKLLNPSTIRKIAKIEGWHRNPTRAYISKWHIAHGAYLLCSDASLVDQSPGQLAESGKMPVEFPF